MYGLVTDQATSGATGLSVGPFVWLTAIWEVLYFYGINLYQWYKLCHIESYRIMCNSSNVSTALLSMKWLPNDIWYWFAEIWLAVQLQPGNATPLPSAFHNFTGPESLRSVEKESGQWRMPRGINMDQCSMFLLCCWWLNKIYQSLDNLLINNSSIFVILDIDYRDEFHIWMGGTMEFSIRDATLGVRIQQLPCPGLLHRHWFLLLHQWKWKWWRPTVKSKQHAVVATLPCKLGS